MPDLSRFGSAPAWSLGVEEELMLVDAETLEPAQDGFSRVFGEATERIKPELFESFVEITTTVVETPEEVELELRKLRHEVAERANEHGLTVIATGSHPTARGRVPIVPVERYRRMKAKLGQRLGRQQVCGLHVHVSVPDSDTCLRAFEGVVPRLPGLLAASANSPYWQGADSGWRSIRSQILLEMPTGGTPPVLRSWDDWQAASRDDSTRRHWDAWPRPEYGTLEVRVMDQPTSLRRTTELTAEVQRLVREAAEQGGAPFDRAEYEAQRDAAGREGGGHEAERQLELGQEGAVRQIASLTLG
ncbi:MAG TPA: YbdK family carboxylate-amine ligase [Gaiellaceae bacterium]|nr:YbdK family carboxylate-amine ligase [Gaiellaceae bacterium]